MQLLRDNVTLCMFLVPSLLSSLCPLPPAPCPLPPAPCPLPPAPCPLLLFNMHLDGSETKVSESLEEPFSECTRNSDNKYDLDKILFLQTAEVRLSSLALSFYLSSLISFSSAIALYLLFSHTPIGKLGDNKGTTSVTWSEHIKITSETKGGNFSISLHIFYFYLSSFFLFFIFFSL